MADLLGHVFRTVECVNLISTATSSTDTPAPIFTLESLARMSDNSPQHAQFIAQQLIIKLTSPRPVYVVTSSRYPHNLSSGVQYQSVTY